MGLLTLPVRAVAEPLALTRRALDDLHVIARALDELPEINRRLAALDGLKDRLDALDRLAVSSDRLSRSTRTLSEAVVPLQVLGELVERRTGLGRRVRGQRPGARPAAAGSADR